jgi:hypothetical protein
MSGNYAGTVHARIDASIKRGVKCLQMNTEEASEYRLLGYILSSLSPRVAMIEEHRHTASFPGHVIVATRDGASAVGSTGFLLKGHALLASP